MTKFHYCTAVMFSVSNNGLRLYKSILIHFDLEVSIKQHSCKNYYITVQVNTFIYVLETEKLENCTLKYVVCHST